MESESRFDWRYMRGGTKQYSFVLKKNGCEDDFAAPTLIPKYLNTFGIRVEYNLRKALGGAMWLMFAYTTGTAESGPLFSSLKNTIWYMALAGSCWIVFRKNCHHASGPHQ